MQFTTAIALASQVSMTLLSPWDRNDSKGSLGPFYLAQSRISRRFNAIFNEKIQHEQHLTKATRVKCNEYNANVYSRMCYVAVVR